MVYRQDHEFILRRAIPEPYSFDGKYDMVNASQPYRARRLAEQKIRTAIKPLARALAPGGRLLTIHACGGDPGIEIIRNVWPDEDPFETDRHALLTEVASQLREEEDDLVMEHLSDGESQFRYEMQAMPVEAQGHIVTSSILAAWNAAAHVAQIDEVRMSEAVTSGSPTLTPPGR